LGTEAIRRGNIADGDDARAGFSLLSPSLYVEENEQGSEELGIHNIIDPEGARCFQQLLLNKSSAHLATHHRGNECEYTTGASGSKQTENSAVAAALRSSRRQLEGHVGWACRDSLRYSRCGALGSVADCG